MKTNPQIQISTGNEIYTYIAIPIENFKQSLEFATPSLEMAPNNMILNVLSDSSSSEIIVQNSEIEPKEVRPTVIEENNQMVNVRKSVILKTKPKGDELYKCEICGETKKAAEYRKHLQYHSNEKKFKCQECSSSYNIENNLKLHMVIHTKGVPTCPICKKVFQRLASLKAHILIHEVKETFTCIECFAEFEKQEAFNKHLKGHKNESQTKSKQKSLTCSFCTLQFNDKIEFKEHVLYHTKVKKLMTKGKKNKKRIKCTSDLPHKCDICKKAFAKFCLLERHRRIHTGEKPFACHMCGRTFTQKGTLQIHLARHAGIKPFQCTLCPAKFCQKGNLRVHVQKTHVFKTPDEKMYKCGMCKCIFKRASSLNAHITRTHANIDNDQEDITIVLDQLKELEKQIDNSRTNKDTCTQFRKEFFSELFKESDCSTVKHVRLADSSIEGTIKQYVVKQRRVGDSFWYLCAYCIKEFKKPSDLIRHIRVHTREKPFKCKQCNQAFSLKSTLQNHISTHIDKRCHKCVICSKSFTSLGTLNAHLRRHDRNAAKSSEQYACNTCNKVFSSAMRAKLHIDEHNLRAQMALVNANVQLKQPMLETENGLVPVVTSKPKSQTNEVNSDPQRPHKCHCGATFTQGVHLKRHMLIHSGERKFKCSVCPKSFYSSYALKEHFQFHIGEKTFGCKVCGKKFVTNAILKRHVTIHSPTKPYVCPYCKKHFKTVILCRKHIKIHKRDINIQIHALNETDELTEVSSEQISNITDEPLNETLFTNAVRNGDYNYLGLTFENDAHTNEPSSKVLYAEKINGVVSENLEKGEMPTTQVVNQNNDALDQQIYADYVEEGKLTESMMPTNMETIDEAITTLGQENSTVYINFDELQTLSASNFYSSCFSNLKNIDPLLMSEINEIQDNNVLFSTDPTLSLADSQLDQQGFEGLIPLTFTSNLSLNTIANPFSNIILSSVVDNELVISTPPTEEPVQEPVEEKNHQTSPILANLLESPNNCKFGGKTIDPIYENVDFTCCTCKVYLKNVQDIMNHACSGTQAKRNQLTSVICSARAVKNEPQEVEVEENKTNDEQQYKCSHCTSVFLNEKALKVHVATHKIKKIDKTCSYCGKGFKKGSDLERHIRTHTGEKPFTCSTCSKSFSLKSTLDSHQQTHNPGGNKDFNCAVCSSYFSSKASLRVHMRMHTGVKPYSCTICSEKFRTAGHRKSHMASHENKKANKSKIAKVSNLLQSVIMDTQQNLQADKNLLTISKPDSLPVGEELTLQEADVLFPNETIQVDSLFLQQLQLNNVLLDDSSGEIPSFIQVDINNEGQITNVKSITEVQETQLEEQTQSLEEPVKQPKEKKFECDICHKKYSAKFILNKHKKIHNNLKCSICDIKFATIDSFNEHVAMHNNSRSFACSLCANRFNLNKELKTHMKRIHNVTLSV